MELMAPALPQGREVDLPGRGTTFVREVPGPPGAPTLLLLHGLAASADLNWHTSFEALGRRFRVLAIDHRGHGRGLRTRRRFRLADCADDAAALLLEEGVERAVVCGYSMGGPIAQLLWRHHPDLVSGFVLCATSRNFRGAPIDRVLFGTMSMAAVAGRFAPRRLIDRLAGRVFPGGDEGPYASWVTEEVRRHDPRMVLEAASAVGRFTSHRWIGDVDVPTSVVVTRRDQLVPPRRQRKLARRIPGATVYEVEGDHFAPASAPGRFVPELVRACSEVAERAACR